MKRLGDVGEMQGIINGSCQRVTGRTLEEWEHEFSNRRGRGLINGDLSTQRVYSIHEANRMSRAYGLDVDDWEAVWVDTGTIERHNPKYKAPHYKGDLAAEGVAFRLNRDRFPDTL